MIRLDTRKTRDYPVFCFVVAEVIFTMTVLAQLYVAWKHWGQTWDDSAITLGFSRTLAATGRIEPTPGSGIVEGYSTTLWMLIMAAVAKIVSDPTNLLAVAKIGTLVVNIANLFLIRAWMAPWMTRTLGALAAGLFGLSFMLYETINGMETPLLLALIFALLLLQRSSTRLASLGYLLCGVALILTRWEAAWFLVPILLGDPIRKRIYSAGGTWLAAFLASNVLRWIYFGSLLPNTIIAKRGPPYTVGNAHEQFLDHMQIFVEIKNSFWWLALVILLYFLLTGFSARRFLRLARNAADYRRSLAILAFCIALAVAIGRNWGPALRCFYPGFPFLIAVILFPLAREVQIGRRRRTLALTFSLIGIIALLHTGKDLSAMDITSGPPYMPGATVEHVREISDAVAQIQIASGRTTLLYAGADMGAVLLYSNGVRVIDLGLLCDRHLARSRYGDVQRYVLDERKPDVIEVHGLWTRLTGFGNDPRFFADYSPLRVSGMRFFVRKELLRAIPEGRVSEVFLAKTETSSQDAGAALRRTQDTVIDDRFGNYFVLR